MGYSSTQGSKGSFICAYPIDRIAQTIAFVEPVMDHWSMIDEKDE